MLNDVIETAETVDTVHMRKESLAAIEELKAKGSELQARALGLGPGRPRRAVDGLRGGRGDRTDRTRHSLRARRRRLYGGPAIRDALGGRATATWLMVSRDCNENLQGRCRTAAYIRLSSGHCSVSPNRERNVACKIAIRGL